VSATVSTGRPITGASLAAGSISGCGPGVNSRTCQLREPGRASRPASTTGISPARSSEDLPDPEAPHDDQEADTVRVAVGQPPDQQLRKVFSAEYQSTCSVWKLASPRLPVAGVHRADADVPE